MRLVMLYRPGSDKAGVAQDYAADYMRLHPDKKIELVSLDSVEGADMLRLYGVTTSPAILALANDGSYLQMWQDEHLPLFQELDYYQTSR